MNKHLTQLRSWAFRTCLLTGLLLSTFALRAELTCPGVTVTGNNGAIQITGLDSEHTAAVQVFTSAWAPTGDGCTWNCGATQTYNVPAGNYIVKVKLFGSSWSPVCEKNYNVTVTGDGGGGGGGGGGACGLTISTQVSNKVCNNNGTPNNPNDDTFTFTLGVTATGTGAMWGVTGGGQTIGYGESATYGPYPISDGTVSFNLVDVDNPSCVKGFSVNPPNTCSNGGGGSTCNNVTNGGTISGNQSGPSGYNPSTITNVESPSGGSGSIQYLWLRSTTACPTQLSQAIPGATSATYNPGPITQTTYYVRCARRAGCTDYIESNCITKTVTGGGGGGGDPCENTDVSTGNGTLTVSGLNGSPISHLQIFNSSWGQEYSCGNNGACSPTETIDVAPGTYYVYVKYYNSSWIKICEFNQTVTVTGGGGGGGGGSNPSISVGDKTVNEGAGTATVQVCLSEPSTQQVKVHIQTMNMSATAGQDYTATYDDLIFAPGQTCKNFTVPIIDDNQVEGTETFKVKISNPVNATIGDGDGIVTIEDNDSAAPTPSITIGDKIVNESAGTATVQVCLSSAATQQVKVNFTTQNNTAIAGQDYTAKSGTVTFQAGQTCKNITINIIDDNNDENTENFRVKLSNPQNATIADGTGVVTITDNDDPAPTPSISIGNKTVNENVGTATVQVCLSSAATQQVKVNFTTQNNTAIAGQDYTAKSGMVTFQVGQTCKNIAINIIDDNNDENTENFRIILSNPQNATIADGTGVVTITDNDDPVDPCAGNNSPQVTVFTDNPSCGQDDGKIMFQFPDNPNRTHIEFSIDGGQTYPLNVADNTGAAQFTGLGAGTYQVRVRWGNDECPVNLGNKTLNDGSQAPGTACNDGNAATTNDVIQNDGCTCAGTVTGPAQCDSRAVNENFACGNGNNPYAFYANDILSGISEGTNYREHNAVFKEFEDGTALLTGTFENIHNPNIKFTVHVTFTGRTANGTPKQPAGATNCNYSIPNNNDLYYYTNFTGTLKGTHAIAGGILKVSRRGEPFQIGTGANLNEANQYGASGWLNYTIQQQPNNSSITFKNQNNLPKMDFNFRLTGGQPDCPVPGDGGGDDCDIDVLFVVGNTNLNTSDAQIRTRLKQLFGNNSVMVMDDNGISGSAANGKELIVISSTVNSGHIAAKFTHKNVGIVTWESYLYDDLKMTGASADWEYGTHHNTSQIRITHSNHPLAAGLSTGVKEVFTHDTDVRWGKPNNHAVKIGRVSSSSDKYMLFGYEQGAGLVGGGTAAGRRVGFFLENDNYKIMTGKGKDLFDAAVQWAAGCSTNGLVMADTDAMQFNATAYDQHQVELEIVPASHQSQAAFTIEHSTDELNWQVIGVQRNEQGVVLYEDHESLPGSNFYRVRVEATDGTVVFGPTRVVVTADAPEFGVFPIPARNELNVDLSTVAEQSVQLELFDALGQRVRQVRIDRAGASAHTLNVSELAPGRYLLRIATDGRAPVSKPVIVVRD